MKNLLIIPLFIIMFNISAQNKYFGGSDIFRFGFEGSRGIDRRTDEVTIGLASLDLTKSKGLLKSDTDAGVLIRTKVSGFDKTRVSQSITLERMYMVNIKRYDKGSISLPIEGSIIESFPLTNNGITYTNIELDVQLMRRRNDSDFGFVVKNIAKLTDELPFPVNPFNPVVSKLAGSLGDMLSSDNDEKNNIEERIPTATINLTFSPNSKLSQKTGVFAVIFGSDEESAGYIDIGKTQDYEWKIEYDPKRVILVKKKSEKKFVELKNDNMMFYVDAYSTKIANSEKDVRTAIGFKDDKTLEVAEVSNYKSKPQVIVSKITSAYWNPQLTDSFSIALNKQIENYSQTSELIKHNTTDSLLIDNKSLLIFDYIKAAERREVLGLQLEKNQLAKPSEIYLKDILN
jgi:hypothetical protein